MDGIKGRSIVAEARLSRFIAAPTPAFALEVQRGLIPGPDTPALFTSRCSGPLQLATSVAIDAWSARY